MLKNMIYTPVINQFQKNNTMLIFRPSYPNTQHRQHY